MGLAADRTETTPSSHRETLSVSSRRVDETMIPLASRALAGARAGDRDALQFLYARYADEVYNYARLLVADHDEAQEVTRRAFSRLERLIDRYDERDVPFPVWIRRVARSVVVDDVC